MRKTLKAVFVVALSFTGIFVQAQSTWSGAGTTGNFSDTGNWDTPPVSGGGNTLDFAGNAGLNATNDITLTSADQTINFNAGASAFTLWGGAIRIGGVNNNSSVLQTIMPSLRLNGTRTFNVGTGGLYLGTPVGSTGTGGRTVTKTGAGDLWIGNGTASSGGAGYNVSAGGLVFTNTAATSLGTAANGVSLTASGTVLRLANAGTLSMGGAISTVSGANVILNNSGAVTVTGGATIAAGANLLGIGNLGGGLVTMNGNLAPGNSGIGTISVASILLGSGSATTLEIDPSAGQNADLVSASGSLTYGGTLTVTQIGGTLQEGESFNLFDGTISGTFTATNLPTLDPAYAWDFSQFGDQGILSIVAAPEPATAALAVMGVVVAVVCGRRRKI